MACDTGRETVNVRVRGIYATALAVMLSEEGYRIVDVSRVLKERLGIQGDEGPAHVTVKTLEERLDSLLVFGHPWCKGEEIYNTIIEKLGDQVFKAKSSLGNNAVVSARVLGFDDKTGVAVLELPDGRRTHARLSGKATPGETVIVTVVNDSPFKPPQVKHEVRIVGDYVIVSYPGKMVSYSEFIRDADRKADLLLTAGFNADLEKYHVHFRSNSKAADLHIIENEIRELAGKIEDLVRNPKPDRPEILLRGEFLGFITLPSTAKAVMDEYRSRAAVTIPLHHSLKSFGQRESSLVECAEDLIEDAKITGIHGLMIAYHLAKNSRLVTIDHIRPDSKAYRLGPFTVREASLAENSISLVLDREFKRPVVLDGLKMEVEPGDKGVTTIRTDSWTVIHEYYTRDGDLIGVYANINTPPEIGGSTVKYLDLLIDVVKRVGKPAEIIDRDELEEFYSRGLIGEPLYRKALQTAEETRRLLDEKYT